MNFTFFSCVIRFFTAFLLPLSSSERLFFLFSWFPALKTFYGKFIISKIKREREMMMLSNERVNLSLSCLFSLHLQLNGFYIFLNVLFFCFKKRKNVTKNKSLRAVSLLCWVLIHFLSGWDSALNTFNSACSVHLHSQWFMINFF